MARAAASLAHPNVVTVYDFGVASGIRAFLVMELLEGSTLRERLKAQKSLPTQQVLCIGPVIPLTPIAKYIPRAVGAWQSLFEHSFAREPSNRHKSAKAFLSELQCAASKSVV